MPGGVKNAPGHLLVNNKLVVTMSDKKGIVFNIQRFTIHDGPGIRTEVFLKGCPMHCKWCSNPESIQPNRQLGIYPAKCISKDKCGACLKACPKEGKPLEFSPEGIITGSNSQCLSCMRCAAACFTHAIKSWGEVMTVEEVMEAVMKDETYYKKSGGGITLNGGEVAVQWEFALEILKACKNKNIHTCVETSMHCSPDIIQKFYKYTDLIFTDIKNMDSEVHKQWSGAGNELILKNIEQTAKAGVKMVIRIPVIPQINDSDENLRKTAAFIRDHLGSSVVQIQLLPYRKMGTEKYASLGLAYPMGEDYKMPERSVWEANLLRIRNMLLEEYHIPVVAGSNERIEMSEL
ncbi:4-hydroxyphenylacetate decarboxylase activating enzyme [uncultured Roseburia sp.]|nr:4-hydroxyphenylacetate decarboxylase activating enzyme [uncultured Roseburia sp.]